MEPSQEGPGTPELEPETRTVGTVVPGTENGTGTPPFSLKVLKYREPFQ